MLITCLLVGSCSFIQQRYLPRDFIELQTISTSYKPDKALYLPERKILFVMEKVNSQIYVYKNWQLINIIGGLGFASNEFNRLNDIAISPDGSLLTLDSFQKKIKKFDPEGNWITEIDLEFMMQPLLFAVAGDETFYIYDGKTGEIVSYKGELAENYHFGRFDLEEPLQISLSRDLLVLPQSAGTTRIFDTLGQFLDEYDDFIQIDMNNYFILHDYYIEVVDTAQKIATSVKPWRSMLIQNNYITVLNEYGIKIIRIVYERS